MSEKNMVLLSQEEIDTLIQFLTVKKDSVDSGVLNQESIDKLILLIKNADLADLKLKTLLSITANREEKAIDLEKLHAVDELVKKRELIFKLNDTTGYVELYAADSKSDQEIAITPNNLNDLSISEDSSRWGYAIAPATFQHVARIFKLKYTMETYTAICERFALKIYGDMNSEIPAIFLPDREEMLESLIAR